MAVINKCLGNCILCGKCANTPILEFFEEPKLLQSTFDGFGIAIDIGTTTVVLALLDFSSSQVIARHSFLNPQRAFGPDVISRIDASNNGSLEELRDAIRESIASNIKILLSKKGIGLSGVVNAAVSANTTMTALLLGFSCESLGVAPFVPNFELAEGYHFSDVFGDMGIDCPLHILPWMAAFVGGDITSGLLFVLGENKQCFMLVDLGTNGEMLLYNKGKITVAATAAGPAFEQPVADKSKDGAGFAGASDVIAALADLVRQGIVNETGASKNEDIFTKRQIRDLQLAKSAIRSGLEILIEHNNLSYEDIEKVYLAGGIGQNIDVDAAVTIGLIPGVLRDKAAAVGNASLGGAVSFLCAPKESKARVKTLLTSSTELNLATHPRFNDCFMKYMFFR